MIEAASRAGRLLYVGQQQRQLTTVRRAREVLAEGSLGRPLLYLERRSSDYTPGARPAWILDRELAGGRVAIDPAGVTVADGRGLRRIVTVDQDREYTLSFARQYQAVSYCLREGASPAVSLTEARTAVAAIHALYESSAAGGARIALHPTTVRYPHM